MKILLAVDDSECSAAAANAVMTQFTPSLAEVQVLHVDDWPQGLPPSMAFVEGAAAAEAVMSLHDLRRENAERLVSATAGRLRGAGFTATELVREGDARSAILECARDWHADLIVLGSHGKNGLNRFLLGSVSEGVARTATCSVEIVRSASERVN